MMLQSSTATSSHDLTMISDHHVNYEVGHRECHMISTKNEKTTQDQHKCMQVCSKPLIALPDHKQACALALHLEDMCTLSQLFHQHPDCILSCLSLAPTCFLQHGQPCIDIKTTVDLTFVANASLTPPVMRHACLIGRISQPGLPCVDHMHPFTDFPHPPFLLQVLSKLVPAVIGSLSSPHDSTRKKVQSDGLIACMLL